MTDYQLRRIPAELWREVKSAASLEGMTIREWILKALREKLEREREE